MKKIALFILFFLSSTFIFADDQAVYDQLIDAINYDDIKAFTKVLSANPKFNVNFTNEYGSTILFQLVENGKLNFLKLLVDKGADINLASADSMWTVLMTAANSGQTEIVNYLILKGAKVNLLTSNNENALHFACNKGYVEIVKALINAKINVNQKDDGDAITPLHWAYWSKGFRKSDMTLVNLLLVAGAEAKAKTLNGQTPLDYEAMGKIKAKDVQGGK